MALRPATTSRPSLRCRCFVHHRAPAHENAQTPARSRSESSGGGPETLGRIGSTPSSRWPSERTLRCSEIASPPVDSRRYRSSLSLRRPRARAIERGGRLVSMTDRHVVVDHVLFVVEDLDASRTLYTPALAALGIEEPTSKTTGSR